MKKRMEIAVPKLDRNWLRSAAFAGVAVGLPMLVTPHSVAGDIEEAHTAHTSVPAKLVEEVRNASRQFLDVNPATAAPPDVSSAASAVQTSELWAFTMSTATWWRMVKSTSYARKR
jgi:hypothetical protein